MKTENGTRYERLRIILAIAGKDILDALRNKILLTIIIGVALVMVQGKALPLLLKLSNTPRIGVYNQADASLVAALRQGGRMQLIEAASRQELEVLIAESSGAILGVVIPPGFGEEQGSDQEISLDGLYAYWMDPDDVVELEAIAESELTILAGQPVDIETQGNPAYPQPDAGGQPFMTSLILVLMTTLICMIIVPYLMIEEKEAHTMDSLLVSPATIGEIVIGKALVGLAYGLVAGAVVLVFHQAQIVHWWIAIAACVAGSLLAVALGLLLGSVFDNITNMNLWMSLLLVVLAAPMLAIRYIPPHWPPFIGAILPWIPTVALYKAYILAFTADPSFGQIWIYLGVVLGSAAVVLAIVVGIVRRSDR